MKRAFLVFCALGLILGLVGAAEAVPLVTNGDFETGTFSGWTQWGNTGATGVTSDSTVVHSGTFSAYFGAVGSDGGINQTIATTPGAQYLLDFWLQNNGGTPSDYSVTWGGGANTCFWNGSCCLWVD